MNESTLSETREVTYRRMLDVPIVLYRALIGVEQEWETGERTEEAARDYRDATLRFYSACHVVADVFGKGISEVNADVEHIYTGC